MIKLNRSADPLRPQLSYYAQGMSVQCIPLENVIHWTILRVDFFQGRAKEISLNKPFLAFQRKVRAYFRLLRRVRNLRFLLNRELGLIGLPPTGVL
jgi:hypothetical protein